MGQNIPYFERGRGKKKTKRGNSPHQENAPSSSPHENRRGVRIGGKEDRDNYLVRQKKGVGILPKNGPPRITTSTFSSIDDEEVGSS